MTEDNAKSKLTLSGKSTLTLKNLGDKAHTHEGKKVVQVEVRKKRVINPNAQPAENNVKIDEATAMKLKLIAEAKEHEARRRQEEEEKERLRRQEREKIVWLVRLRKKTKRWKWCNKSNRPRLQLR